MRLDAALEYLDNIEGFQDCRVSIYIKYGPGCMTTVRDALDPSTWMGKMIWDNGWLDHRVLEAPHLDQGDRIVFRIDSSSDNESESSWVGFYDDDEFAMLEQASRDWEEDAWYDEFEEDDR